MKKSSDTKKSSDDAEESSVASNVSSSASKAATKDDDDVYEFKTTPKDSSSSSGDDKSDGGKGSDKSSDEKSDDQGTKRSYSDVEGDGDEDVKRKKRKDAGEAAAKDSAKGSTSRTSSQRQDKAAKAPSTAAKSSSLTNKNVAALDRKSPCVSPKPNSTKADSDAETDDKNSGDGFNAVGPKVPPLKIVIPQTTTADQEAGTRNGKNISTRNHVALPYVVASSSNSNDSADKESASSRCTSPSDSAKGADEKKPSATQSGDDQKQQRVLRSSNRGGQSVDRGSNNSSPQLQSSSPSPAPVSQASTTTSSATATTTSTTTTESGEASKQPAVTGSQSGGGSSATSPSNQLLNSEVEPTNAPSPSASSTSSTKESIQSAVELHPRKRKIRASKDENKQAGSANPSSTQSNSSNDANENVSNAEIHPHEQPNTNCYQMFLTIRKQIERRHRNLFPVQPKPPQGFKDYLMNRRSYVLEGKSPAEPVVALPASLAAAMKDTFAKQEKERHKLKMQHAVEKEKLVLSVEQEILRVHGRAARALANQSLPFSVCTVLKDEEVYNMITPEQEEKDRNARSRYNGRLFLSWLQDVDDKWEKIKVRTAAPHFCRFDFSPFPAFFRRKQWFSGITTRRRACTRCRRWNGSGR